MCWGVRSVPLEEHGRSAEPPLLPHLALGSSFGGVPLKQLLDSFIHSFIHSQLCSCTSISLVEFHQSPRRLEKRCDCLRLKYIAVCCP